ncbi:hypothetical protein TIFTF001_026220 [Ficus carica]|uniref:Uncharacterized protein n=1 Tax=Ficus carica TaxID=3494 RepID=A0AA88DKU3_FICCA|nr:hypothetical protein TIFTF001_026220 [Ficus carica]
MVGWKPLRKKFAFPGVRPYRTPKGCNNGWQLSVEDSRNIESPSQLFILCHQLDNPPIDRFLRSIGAAFVSVITTVVIMLSTLQYSHRPHNGHQTVERKIYSRIGSSRVRTYGCIVELSYVELPKVVAMDGN